MRAIITAIALPASIHAAAADWRIHHERDRMTDSVTAWATVTAESDQGATGTLMLVCLVDDLVGGYLMNVHTD